MMKNIPLTYCSFIQLGNWLCVKVTQAFHMEDFILTSSLQMKIFWVHSLHLDMAAFFFLTG